MRLTTTLQTINRVKALWDAAEARRDRPAFVPPAIVSGPAKPVSFDRWKRGLTFARPEILFPKPSAH